MRYALIALAVLVLVVIGFNTTGTSESGLSKPIEKQQLLR